LLDQKALIRGENRGLTGKKGGSSRGSLAKVFALSVSVSGSVDNEAINYSARDDSKRKHDFGAATRKGVNDESLPISERRA